MYKVIGTETYLNEIKNWEKTDSIAASKLPLQLSENPHAGKPLGYSFFREKKVGEKRVYYLVYDELSLVLLIATSGKKDQQQTINHIKDRLGEFKRIAEEIIKQVS